MTEFLLSSLSGSVKVKRGVGHGAVDTRSDALPIDEGRVVRLEVERCVLFDAQEAL
jgi:hypothetical protein